MWMEEQHQHRLSDMKELYKEEIRHLMEGHGSLQKLTAEKDRDIEELHDKLERQALEEEELRTEMAKQLNVIAELQAQLEQVSKAPQDQKEIYYVEVPV